GAAVLGVLALPPISGMLADALGGHGQVPIVELAVSAVIAVVVVLLMLRLRTPEPRWARRWLGLDAVAQAVVVRPSLTVAHALARFDDHVLEDRKSTRLNSSHVSISYAVFCLRKKKKLRCSRLRIAT